MHLPARRLLCAFIITTLAGGPLHFLYDWVPNPVTALFSPVNESLWEHGKLIFWPILGAAFFLNRSHPRHIRPWLVSLPLLLALMLGVGYLYHVTWGGEAMWVDLLLYAVLMALGFWLPTRFSPPFRGGLWAVPVLWTAALGVSFALFTRWPPHHILFQVLE